MTVLHVVPPLDACNMLQLSRLVFFDVPLKTLHQAALAGFGSLKKAAEIELEACKPFALSNDPSLLASSRVTYILLS